MGAVEAWDRALRDGDRQTARAMLAGDATYTAPGSPEDGVISCTTPEQIVAPMRSWKGKLPVVQVVGWEPRGDHVVAHLRQPAFGDDARSVPGAERTGRADREPRGPSNQGFGTGRGWPLI